MPDALLLLPGLLNDSALWSHQIDGVADLVDDIRVPDLTRHETVREIAAAILAEAPSRFALAGLSMGGYVAPELLRQAPERVVRLAPDRKSVLQGTSVTVSVDLGGVAPIKK